MPPVYKGDDPLKAYDLYGSVHPRLEPSVRRTSVVTRKDLKAARARTAPTYSIWICKHVVHCPHRAACANATFLGKPEQDA